MKLKGGLNLDDDDTQVKYEKADLNNAGRDKTGTQKNLDDMLFGNRPVRRRGQKPTEQSQKNSVAVTPVKAQQPIKKQSDTKVSPFPPRTPPRNSSTASPAKNNEAQGSNKLVRTNLSRVKLADNAGTKSAQSSDRKPADPEVAKADVQPSKVYNRAVYIRKLKKMAQNYEYHHLNADHHRYYDIIRQGDCQRERIQKQETNNFIDIDFPHLNCSVGHHHRKQQINWKKSKQIFRKTSFGKYIDPNDIQPGKYSSPVFLSVLACLAEREQNIKRLIENQGVNSNGFYYVRLNINGIWRYIAVDDYLPAIAQQNIGLTSFKDNQSQLCLSLIQKAYAKAFHSYQIFARQIKPEQYLKDLTGCTIRKYDLEQVQIKQCIQNASKQNWTIIAQPSQTFNELGFDSRYCLCVKSVNNRGIIQLRNSWGTTLQKPKINQSKEGIIEIKAQQFKKYFKHIIIAETNDQYFTSTIQSKHEKAFYSCYSFELKSQSKLQISINQWDRKLFPSTKQYSYSSFHVVLEKKQKDGERTYVASGFSNNQQSLTLSLAVQPGCYNIYCIGSWLSKGINYHLTLSANQIVKFKRVYINESPKQITKCLEKVNIEHGKKTTRGPHINQFLLHHQTSNLVILTIGNSGDKNINHNQDLTKIKADTIEQITATVPESSKLNKNQPLKSSRKTDSVNLGANESHTWVFSVSKREKNPNLRQWGFK